MQQRAKHILFCKCGGERVADDLLTLVDNSLKDLPVNVTCLSDFCGLAARGKQLLKDLFNPDTDYLILGCYRRTMDLLIEQVSGPFFNTGNIKYINLFELNSTKDASDQIESFCSGVVGTGSYRELNENSGWQPWYPVLDYSRCTACGQCAEFCLFGVYEKTETRVEVRNPHLCKNNCPACARICPVTAIIFPKYKNGGAIGGSDDIDEQAEQQRQVQDIESILGIDLYSALEKRKIKRQSIIREEAMKKAVSERDKALGLSKKDIN
jgi:ferredoxin